MHLSALLALLSPATSVMALPPSARLPAGFDCFPQFASSSMSLPLDRLLTHRITSIEMLELEFGDRQAFERHASATVDQFMVVDLMIVDSAPMFNHLAYRRQIPKLSETTFRVERDYLPSGREVSVAKITMPALSFLLSAEYRKDPFYNDQSWDSLTVATDAP